MDEISGQPGMHREFIKKKEINLLKNVDYVFVTSKTLLSKKIYNKNTFYFGNVADYNHFSKAVTIRYEMPKDLHSDIQKKVGFIGAISGYKLDFGLILNCAKSLPEVDFYFIGKIGEGEPNTDVEILNKQKNIIFLGPKDYSVLPQYLQFFDACILPCNINEYTDNMFPMKFFEYLAAGKAVVATELKSILDYKDYCYISKNENEFINNIQKTIDIGKDPSLILKRQLLAQEFTYESRMRNMLNVILKDRVINK